MELYFIRALDTSQPSKIKYENKIRSKQVTGMTLSPPRIRQTYLIFRHEVGRFTVKTNEKPHTV